MSEGQNVQSVERAMAVLDAVAASGEPVSAKALARRFECSLSTVYNLVNTLMAGGYLERTAGGYLLGGRISTLHQARVGDRSAEGIEAVLDQVQWAAGASAYYSRLRDGNVVVEGASHAPGPGPMFPLGPDPTAHATAHGKVLLAGLERPARDRYLKTAGMRRLTDRTITHPDRLEFQLQRVRRSGVATAVEESAEGEACVSVPVTVPDGRVLAAVSAALPARTLEIRREQVVRALLRGAQHAARLLRDAQP
ncbi:IclR family transcriptional regulator [Allosalinactinospora lopnorensis]|uniref:IclR family transcriptional regulator n=1 Tax=Allosalinactinospora lopnorensis TaxID=1352348 RepID=UPI000623CB7F|nr:IclR family transcriptional regulator C-terminal domain-containing protein [Allosalinactinospora lopnorensis]